MNKIWLDVTTILAWQRPAVGIIRVEAECATYALQTGNEQIQFCCYAANSGYLKVDPTDVRAALDRILGAPPTETASPTETAPPIIKPSVSNGLRFKARVLWLINLLPDKLRIPILSFALERREAIITAIRGYRELKHALKIFLWPPKHGFLVSQPTPQIVAKIAERPVAPFGAGDVYISLGLDWDQKDLAYLYQQKRNIGFKVLLFCYDVIPIKLPHLCVGDVAAAFARYFVDVAWCADQVLCISECSMRDLQALLTELGAPIPPLAVVKLGCQPAAITTDVIAPDVGQVIGRRYILFVSTIERRKNHETLYHTYVRLIEQGEKDLPLLVFVGMPGWGINDLLADLHFDSRIKDLIKVLNHVTDADLARLYQNTLFTVFPSLYEGWGLPIAESLAYGKFCLASNVASIPEVGGDLIEYIDPWDVPKWAERIKWYIDHEADLILREHQIKNQYKPVTWESCASFIFKSALEKV